MQDGLLLGGPPLSGENVKRSEDEVHEAPDAALAEGIDSDESGGEYVQEQGEPRQLCCGAINTVRIGNYFVYGMCGKERMLFVGPDWPTLIVTICGTIAPALLAISLLPPKLWPLGLIMLLLMLLTLSCLIALAVINPGIVKSTPQLPGPGCSYCQRCSSYRPPDALHCSDCNVCIESLDHHCVWTGKCIGRGNGRVFKAFVTLFPIQLALAIGLLLQAVVLDS